MFSLLKKDTDTDEKPASKPDLTAGTYYNQQDFIPYLVHYAPDTILTKNGELLKTIRISGNNFGLNYESGQGTNNTLRDIIRRAIGNAVHSDKYAFWIHTLRRRDPVHHESRYENDFANYVNNKWRQKNNWQQQYHNEIYITLIYDGQSAEFIDKKNMQHVILPDKNRALRNAYLSSAHANLSNTVDTILTSISQHYNAHCLSVVERAEETASGTSRNIFYSEPMEFLGNLCNLRTEAFPAANNTIDTGLCTHELIFGYNALEAKNNKGEKRFAGILTLKHFQDITTETVDHILQFPGEFIISQSFHYVPHTVALKPYKLPKLLFEMSEDEYSYKKTGLEAKFRANQKKPTDYGRQQTTIMVLVDDFSQLENEISKIQQAFASLGLPVVREDIKLEEAYWSQLPGNFEFLRRQDTIIASEIAAFCRLNLFPNGKSTGNHWGNALALIPTTVNSPYFFNLHHQDNGHTLLFDYNSFNDQSGLVLLNFLITTSLKYQPRLYVFDRKQSARLFFEKTGGSYHLFPFGIHKRQNCGLNPFSLENTARNQSFLLAWCCTLIEPFIQATEHHRELIRHAIAELYESPESQRNLAGFLAVLSSANPELVQAFSHYHGRGQFAGLFDAPADTVNLDEALHAFDISEEIHTNQMAVPLFSYLMHRIINRLDGRPAIIVLHEALRLFENDFFAPRLESLLEMLRQNNVIVISSVHSTAENLATQSLNTLMQCCATRIYMPDDVSLSYASDIAGLNTYDSDMLRRMQRQKGEFLLKQQHDSIGLRVDLEHMDDIRAILAGDIKNLIAAGGAFASLPEFY